jgi:hypothetical protein
MTRKLIHTASAFLLLSGTLALAQKQMPMNMDHMGEHMGATADQPKADDESAAPAMEAMSSHHMDMGPHMKMTTLREAKPGDRERADEIAWTTGLAIEKYRDYKVALKDGFRIFLPNVPQKVYHFTNYWYAFEAQFRLNPEEPTSLLYEKTGDGYKLVGAMYTAPARASDDELDRRVPLSVAQWHLHVNFCAPPESRRKEMFQPQPQFGLAGSIATKEACDKAGGKFSKQLFGWMVHVYPFEKKPENIWAVEPPNEHGGGHMHMH